jgi:hypothetical protein
VFSSNGKRLVWASNETARRRTGQRLSGRLGRVTSTSNLNKDKAALAIKIANKRKIGNHPDGSVRVLISHARIRRRVREIAQDVRRDFRTNPSTLSGSSKVRCFLADLARELGSEVSFILGVSSYGRDGFHRQ